MCGKINATWDAKKTIGVKSSLRVVAICDVFCAVLSYAAVFSVAISCVFQEPRTETRLR